MRELTDDEMIQRGQMAMELLQSQAIQLIINEMIAEAITTWHGTEPKNFKEREDCYHMVKALEQAVEKAKQWAQMGATVLAERQTPTETE